MFLRPDAAGEPLRDGTDEQRRFVGIALATPDFAILEGPPGSGKTTAICELIAQLARRGQRVLLVASTNVAVDNVLERLLEWQNQLPADERYVLPVRIGDRERISIESIEPFLHAKFERSVRDDIQDFLDDQRGNRSTGSESREMLATCLRRPPVQGIPSPLTMLIAESVNLVCGTPIGVLQHPEIRAHGRPDRDQPRALFDVLIVDEASKTTFTEFLVPAIYAKKWIIVGDIQQLSPYVESEDITENLRHAIDRSTCASTATPRCWPTVQGPRVVSSAASLRGRRRAATRPARIRRRLSEAAVPQARPMTLPPPGPVP
ncbi:MAG: AAA family ATPase [Deltaproteobacteria bacterium]|nr:AAA family ATPase [Deltaproteobacteria bacterium]